MKTILLAAITANGLIAVDQHHPATWTSKADKQFFVQKTKAAGVMIMGRTTFATIGRPLPDRLTIVLTKNPNEHESIPNSVEYTSQTPNEIIQQLAARGFNEVIIAGGASIYTQFLKEDLVDEIYLTVEPYLFGSGINLLSESALHQPLKLEESSKLSDNVILLHYRINHE